MTAEGDLVLVYMEGTPSFFARIEEIVPDSKPEWYHVKMLVLQVPLVVITWILRSAYIHGDEFTMGGRPVKLVKVVSPEGPGRQEAFPGEGIEPEAELEPPGDAAEKGKVISLANRRKKDPPQ